MQEEKVMDNEVNWKRGVNEPFEGGREKFASIAKAERSEFTKKILQTQQLTIPPPFQYQEPFTTEGDMPYLGHNMHYYSLENTPFPKAILVMIHGVNSNGGTFGYIAHRIAQKNKEVNIYAFDQLNFGKSTGETKGYISSLEDSARDSRAFIEFLISKWEKKPKVFLCGHSYGGGICIKLALQTPNLFSGMILLTPLLKDCDQMFYYAKRAMKFVGWLFPRYGIKKTIPPGLGTKYNVKNKFLNDPYIFTEAIMPGTIRATMNAADQIYSSFEKITTPFLCIAAGVEKLLDPFAALDLEERSPAEDKRVIYCQEMWHVVTEQKEVVGLAWHCAEWLKERA